MAEESTVFGDDEPVVFGYEATCNPGFSGSHRSIYTWGEWRKMTPTQQSEAKQDFIEEELGVNIFVVNVK